MISSWISVDDALPDDDVTVLIHCPSSSEPVWLGYLDTDETETDQEPVWRDVSGMTIDDDVTHWQPLPAPPTE